MTAPSPRPEAPRQSYTEVVADAMTSAHLDHRPCVVDVMHVSGDRFRLTVEHLDSAASRPSAEALADRCTQAHPKEDPVEKLVFRDISTELQRTYTFPDGAKVTIEAPVQLHVSASQTHRIVDAAGASHIIPWGWIHLEFKVKDGAPPFSF